MNFGCRNILHPFIFHKNQHEKKSGPIFFLTIYFYYGTGAGIGTSRSPMSIEYHLYSPAEFWMR